MIVFNRYFDEFAELQTGGGEMWVIRIFAREFGYSDVQSNYSRVYSWMANQLGHMTLGLLTAFFFVWIADTISAALRVMAAGEITLSGLFILLPSVFVISAIVFIAGKNVLAPTERQDPVSTTAATRYCAIRPGMRLAINIAFLASFGLMLCYLLPSAMAGAESDVIITGKLTAISAIIAGILLLCRDIRYLIGAFTAVFVTSLVTLGEAVPDDGLRLALVLGFSVFFLIFGLASTIYSNNIPDRPEGPEFRISSGRWLSLPLPCSGSPGLRSRGTGPWRPARPWLPARSGG